MKVILFLLIILLVQVYSALTALDPANNPVKEYKFYSSARVNWYNAYQSCLNYGMKLATINSQEEQESLQLQLKGSGLSNQEFWISGTDLAEEGQFYWFSSGNRFNYTNWREGQPDNWYVVNQTENCVLLMTETYNTQWNDASCLYGARFICESGFEC